MDEVVVHQIRVDAVFHRFHDIETRHELFHACQFLGRHGFKCEAKVVVGAVGDAVAHDAARFGAVVADTEHAGGDDRDFTFFASGLRCAISYFLLGPFVDAQIEAGAENHSVGGTAGELQTLWVLLRRRRSGQAC